MSEITSRIDSLLSDKGLRRADLVRATGINEGTYRSWIKNGTCPKADDLYQIAVYLNVPIEYLLFGVNPADGGESIPFDTVQPTIQRMYEDLTETDKEAVRHVINSLYRLTLEREKAAKNDDNVASNVAN